MTVARAPLIIREYKENGIVVLRLNRPAKRNAFNDDMFNHLKTVVSELEQNPSTRVMIITGSRVGEKAFFSSGIDLMEITQGFQEDPSGKLLMQKAREWQGIFSMIARSPLPFICAIEGACFGSGLELALACDLRVATKEAQLGLLETRLGIIADLGGTTRLTKLVGPSTAKRLILLAEIISGEEALNVGLVDFLAPSEKTALEMALDVAEKIARNGPLAVKASKKLINLVSDLRMDEALALELKEQEKLLSTADALEGFIAAMEKRSPRFQGK